MNRKGMAIGLVFGIFIVVAGLMIGASKLHKQQRIDKQQTAEGRAEYPMK